LRDDDWIDCMTLESNSDKLHERWVLKLRDHFIHISISNRAVTVLICFSRFRPTPSASTRAADNFRFYSRQSHGVITSVHVTLWSANERLQKLDSSQKRLFGSACVCGTGG
jgi:hypothetical protein